MDDPEAVFYVTVSLVLWAAIAIALWRCYRRSRNASFLWLGIALVVWPVVDVATDALYLPVMRHVMNGKREWLSDMTPGELKARFESIKHLLGLGLIAFSLSLLARSFKR